MSKWINKDNKEWEEENTSQFYIIYYHFLCEVPPPSLLQRHQLLAQEKVRQREKKIARRIERHRKLCNGIDDINPRIDDRSWRKYPKQKSRAARDRTPSSRGSKGIEISICCSQAVEEESGLWDCVIVQLMLWLAAVGERKMNIHFSLLWGERERRERLVYK